MPETASGLTYGVGFVLATAALHALGIGFGIFAMSVPRVRQFSGSAMALAGIGILAGLI
jgi:urease accessory protein